MENDYPGFFHKPTFMSSTVYSNCNAFPPS